ncbi:hypothetical protein [Stutzerimonas azotifigens]|uniref:hypothetical protein n=1 Tax=Stutzerimonas azotifigens TaxID=291995 RepID=UPI000422A88A|nr:hypothetical protein [Stutzerimonas azotifigens]
MSDTQETATQQPQAPAQHPWNGLAPERFHLLRLAPLATDRNGPRPLRFVELGEVERHSPQLSLLRLTIRVPGEASHRDHNLLEVWADHRTREVRFGPDSGLRLNPANRGLGRFLLARGAAWAKKRWGQYQLEGGALGTAANEEQRLIRDRMLLAQGFEVTYADARQLKAVYAAPSVSALSSDWNPERVGVVPLAEAGGMLEQADRNLDAQENQIRQLNERIAQLRREDGTLRFTVACLVAFALFQGGLLIWIATR